MKFLAVFSAVLAVAMAATTSWTIPELSDAIQNPSTNPALVPLLEEALNELMMETFNGNPQPVTSVSTVVQDFSLWTLNELSEAIQSPSTDAALLPYLEHALNTMMTSLMSGQAMESIIVATPVGLLPVTEVAVPIVPVPVETPVIAETPVISEAAASPLVQIIVNVNAQSPATPAVVPEPTVVPEPAVVPEVPVVPGPVNVVDGPIPVVPNPVDVIAINPETAVNPIDVVAVTAPEVNPVDILSPIPVVAPVGAIDGIIV